MTIDGDRVERNPAYYSIAHVSRFVAPGSVRVGSSGGPAGLHHVAFATPDDRVAVVMVNDGPLPLTVHVATAAGDRQGPVITVPAGAVASCARPLAPSKRIEP